ncbi:MAG: hypothetical protein DME25_21520, partial [Verrucomicrobia bacterium]
MLVAMVGLEAACLWAAPRGNATATTPTPHHVLVTDSGAWPWGGVILDVDLASGRREIVVAGLDLPLYAAFDPAGCIWFTGAGRIARLCRVEGQGWTLSGSVSLPSPGYALGLAVDRRGKILCATFSGVVQIDTTTLSVEEVANLPGAIGLAVCENDDVIVLMRNPARLVRVSRHSGKVTPVSEGGLLQMPQSLVLNGHDLFVSDVSD